MLRDLSTGLIPSQAHPEPWIEIRLPAQQIFVGRHKEQLEASTTDIILIISVA